MSARDSVLSAAALQEKAMRDGIDDLLAACTEKQVSFFHRIHDNAPWEGIANCPANKLSESYELLRRTVEYGDSP